MKVVFLNPSGQPGGAEAILLDTLTGLRRTQPDWPLHLILGEGGPVSERAAALGVSVDVLPFPPALARLGDAGAGGPAGRQIGWMAWARKFAAALPAVFQYRRRLKKALAQARPGLLHSNGFKMHLLGVWARPAGTPVIWHVHDYVSKRPLMARLMRMFAGRCGAAVTNSQSVADDLRGVCPQLKIHAVLNGIDLERFVPVGPGLDLDALAGMPPAPAGTVKIGLLGTMARWKGQGVFLEALSKLPADLPVRGYMIGGSLYQTEGSQWKVEELRGLAARLGVAERVGFTGFTNRPEAALRSLDVVVHASTEAEPFGLVITEAMACGRPVIASNAGGAAEIAGHGAGALLHAPGDAAALARSMERLARDPELRAQLGRQGRATAERAFDRTRLAEELLRVYGETAPLALPPSLSRAREAELEPSI